MSGNQGGGKKAAATNRRLYGEDYYQKLGALGGKVGRTGGFYVNRELARTAGAKGGAISKRKPAKPIEKRKVPFYEGPMVSSKEAPFWQRFLRRVR